MIFDFQREMPSGRWSDLGITRLPDELIDFDLAFRALTQQLGGKAPQGRYRYRLLGGEESWRYGQVDQIGRFRHLGGGADHGHQQ